MSHLSLVPPLPKPVLSLLTPAFQEQLATFNKLTRDLRDAGATVQSLDFPDKRIVVLRSDVDMISRRFAHEIRSQSSKTLDRHTRHSVRIRDMYVSWYTPVKEQDQ